MVLISLYCTDLFQVLFRSQVMQGRRSIKAIFLYFYCSFYTLSFSYFCSFFIVFYIIMSLPLTLSVCLPLAYLTVCLSACLSLSSRFLLFERFIIICIRMAFNFTTLIFGCLSFLNCNKHHGLKRDFETF